MIRFMKLARPISSLKRFALIVALAVTTLSTFAPASAQTTDVAEPAVIAAPSTNDIHEFQRLLGDERIQNWLKEAAEATGQPTDETVPVASVPDYLKQLVKKIRLRRLKLREAWQQAGSTPDTIKAIWTSNLSETATLQAITYLVIFLFVGAGFEWLYAQYTGNRLLKLELQKLETLRQRVRVGGARAFYIFGSVFVFAIGSVGTFLLFDWHTLVENIVLEILVGILVVRATITISRFFLSPRIENLRLVPLSNVEAKSLHLRAIILVSVGAISLGVYNVFNTLTAMAKFNVPDTANLSIGTIGAIVCALVAIFCIWSYAKIASNDQKMKRGNPNRFWATYLSVLVIATFVLGLIEFTNLMGSVAILGLLFPATIMMRNWVDYLYDEAEVQITPIDQSPAIEANVEGEEGDELITESQSALETAETSEPVEPTEDAEVAEKQRGRYDTYRPIVSRLVRFALVIFAVVGLVLIWGNSVFAMAGIQTTGNKIFKIAIDVTIALLIADLAWVWVKTAIDNRLADYRPPEDGHAPGPEARMATLLPLLRTIVLVTLLTMVGLTVLSSFGVNIGPLLAGAGVLGVAIGFGAQALVRDVVAGIFFLIDDAFRIGEYIEVENLRGTVEAMSIRSLRVRHHRGAVHTIPFGELKALTNYSRDWVIMKLEFRVPFDTDMQLVKRLVKKIGVELKENPDFKDSIIETLKSQGVRRMEEFNMVIGVKFMTKPGEQWVIRREAYHKVRDAFEANGIGFAERNVKVEVLSDKPLDEETKKAVMGAAQSAIESRLPPAPAPDEP